MTPDTNVLLRVAVNPDNLEGEDRRQVSRARATLHDAQTVCITLPALCELVWVLRKAYRHDNEQLALAVSTLCAGASVILDRSAVEAGLAMLRAGGDFADAVIAHQGALMGAETFVSFDRKAVRLLTRSGQSARLA